MKGPRGRALPAILTIALGATIAVQSRVNGQLSHDLGNGLAPAWLTMATGAALLLVLVALHRATRQGAVRALAQVRAGALPWGVLTGGIFGAFFLIAQAVTVPLVGVAVFSVGVVAGQTTGSLVVDRLGISASGVRQVSANRVLASVLAVVAVGIAISDRVGTAQGAGAFALAAFIAGALIAPQQAANGRVAVAARSPFSAATVNFVGGALVLTTALAIAAALGAIPMGVPLGSPWWAYLGGPIGLLVIAGAAWVVPTLGVLVFSLLSLMGQLTGALALDLAAPTPGTVVGWPVVAGVVLTGLAVVLAGYRRR
ncbi:MAG: DMT family transporter [Candidatus Nanopelagicales bacterium]